MTLGRTKSGKSLIRRPPLPTDVTLLCSSAARPFASFSLQPRLNWPEGNFHHFCIANKFLFFCKENDRLGFRLQTSATWLIHLPDKPWTIWSLDPWLGCSHRRKLRSSSVKNGEAAKSCHMFLSARIQKLPKNIKKLCFTTYSPPVSCFDFCCETNKKVILDLLHRNSPRNWS